MNHDFHAMHKAELAMAACTNLEPLHYIINHTAQSGGLLATTCTMGNFELANAIDAIFVAMFNATQA